MKKKLIIVFYAWLLFGCEDISALSKGETKNQMMENKKVSALENDSGRSHRLITINGTFYTQDKSLPFVEVPAIASIQSMDKQGKVETIVKQNVKATYETGFVGRYSLTINTKEFDKEAFLFVHIEAKKDGKTLWENNKMKAKLPSLIEDYTLNFIVQ